MGDPTQRHSLVCCLGCRCTQHAHVPVPSGTRPQRQVRHLQTVSDRNRVTRRRAPGESNTNIVRAILVQIEPGIIRADTGLSLNRKCKAGAGLASISVRAKYPFARIETSSVTLTSREIESVGRLDCRIQPNPRLSHSDLGPKVFFANTSFKTIAGEASAMLTMFVTDETTSTASAIAISELLKLA